MDGQPWCCGCNWSSFYALDIDHPEVQAYLKQVFDRVLQDWGFDLVKLDFLYGAAPFGNAGNPAQDGCSAPWHCCAHGAATS